VVTLIPQNGSDLKEITWGVAYKISDDKIDSILDHLDFREKGGYCKSYIDVFTTETGEPTIKGVI